MILTEAVILAGGKGTRLKSILNGLPKPLVNIAGIPLLERQIKHLIANQIQKIFVLVNHKSHVIEKFIIDKKFDISIEILDDGDKPLGTAGSVLNIIDNFSENFLVVYGDTLFNVDIKKFSDFHFDKNKNGISIFTHPNDHPYDSDIVEVFNDNVLQIHPYPHPQEFYKANLVNAALYIVNKSSLKEYSFDNELTDFAKDVFTDDVILKKLKSYKSFEYIKDCGTPDRVAKVEKHIKSKIFQNSIINKNQKVIYLDRDGTLIKNVDHLKSIAEIEIFDETFSAIKKINDKGDRAVVITNQPVISRGDLTEKGLKDIHDYIEWQLGKKNVFIDEIYYCPHHPDKGFNGEVPELKFDCDCRKPKVGMLKDSLKKFNTDINNSWLIGDTTTDIKTAKNFSLKNILLRTGFAGNDFKYHVDPEFIMNNVGEAVDFIYNGYENLIKICEDNLFEKLSSRIITISGQSRSGKSTFSKVLYYYLLSKGLSPKLINLDKFLLPLEQRGNDIFSKFDLDKIEILIQNLSTKNNFNLELPYYNKIKRKQSNHYEKVSINSNNIVIFEGLIAGSFKLKNKFSIFIRSDEKVRMKRFVDEYLSRKIKYEVILKKYDSRLKNEFLEIEKLSINSNKIINI
jgi:D,D-heptose 1,7-bisphosphate phosphatase